MAQSISKLFQTALVYLLEQEGRGAQSRLAGQYEIDRGYLNAIVKGRKTGGDELRSKIATNFNLTYEDMLALGRRLVNEQKEGVGERKDGAEQEVPPSSDTARGKGEVIDLTASQKPGDAQSLIAEKIIKAVKILESGTVCGDVLADLIDAFNEVVSTKKDNLALQNRMKDMESRIVSLETMLGKKECCVEKSA